MLYCRSNILEVLDRALSRMIPHLCLCFLQSCNKSLINQACSGPYWENIGLGLICTDLAALSRMIPHLCLCFLQSCNKSLINQACLGPYWENIGPRSFLLGTVLGEYRPSVFFDPRPIFSQYGPRAWFIRYITLMFA